MVSGEIDAGRFGTFSRNVKRTGTPIDAPQEKILAGIR
jgi:hypothetical protein